MSIVESTAEFEARLKDLGLHAFLGKFGELGVTTLSELAYCSDWIPGGSVSSEVFAKDVLIPVLGSAEHLKRHGVKRLFSEAYIMAAADLRRKVEPQAEEAATVMPVQEREQRRTALETKLVGMELTGELDPSFKLCNLVHGMHEANTIQYLEWSCLTKRSQELNKVKEIKAWQPDSSGFMKEHVVTELMPARTDTDYLLRCALSRRGLALEIGRVCSFKVHEALVELFFKAMYADRLDGFDPVQISQIKAADQEVWRLVAESCRAGIRAEPDGTLPVERILKVLVLDASIRYILMPFRSNKAPPATASSCEPASVNKGHQDASSRRVRQLEQQVADLKRSRGNQHGSPQPPSQPQNSWEKKEANRKRGRGGKKQDPRAEGGGRCPPGLVGKKTKTDAGDPICFDYNLDGCSMASAGGRCPRGLHICAEPGCRKSHEHGLKHHR